jgi:hypothetical protein
VCSWAPSAESGIAQGLRHVQLLEACQDEEPQKKQGIQNQGVAYFSCYFRKLKLSLREQKGTPLQSPPFFLC